MSLGYECYRFCFAGTSEATSSRRSFFVEYLITNPSLGRDKPVLGQSKFARQEGLKPSYLMVKAGSWGGGGGQLNRFFGLKRVDVRYEPDFEVCVGDCFLSSDALKGCISVSQEDSTYFKEWMCDSGSMAWSIVMERRGPKARFKGEVLWNGEKYKVSYKDSYGFYHRSSGADFPEKELTLNLTHFKSEILGKWIDDSALSLSLNQDKLAGFFKYGDSEIKFNPRKFLSFYKSDYSLSWNKKQMTLTLEVHCRPYTLKADLVFDRRDLLGLSHETPQGKRPSFTLWTSALGRGKVFISKGGKLVDRLLTYNVTLQYKETKKQK